MTGARARDRRSSNAADTAPEDAALTLLLFEAAGCLMALPVAEVARLLAPDAQNAAMMSSSVSGIDLGEYFTGCRSNGPWFRWGRGDKNAWLRVRQIAEVMLCPLRALSPMPALLRDTRLAGAFWAAGVLGNDVFLLLDPARLIDVPHARTR